MEVWFQTNKFNSITE